jgi:hypothetical protein
MEQLVEKYIELRDAKAAAKKVYEGKVAKLEAVMDKIEAVLLQQFQEQGIESMRTKAGTAYKQERTSVTVADRQILLDFAREKDEWGILDIRAAKTGIEEFKAVHNDLPPGINYRSELVINVRRS